MSFERSRVRSIRGLYLGPGNGTKLMVLRLLQNVSSLGAVGICPLGLQCIGSLLLLRSRRLG